MTDVWVCYECKTENNVIEFGIMHNCKECGFKTFINIDHTLTYFPRVIELKKLKNILDDIIFEGKRLRYKGKEQFFPNAIHHISGNKVYELYKKLGLLVYC